jgi:hypothetical protein
MFWMPDQVRHDDLRTFYETIKIEDLRMDLSLNYFDPSAPSFWQ